jgi:hypothetical protein
LTSIWKQIEKHLDQAHALLEQAGEAFSNLFTDFKKYSRECPAKEQQLNCLAHLNNLSFDLSQSFQELSGICNKSLSSFFRYLRHETYSGIEMLDRYLLVQKQNEASPSELGLLKADIFREEIHWAWATYTDRCFQKGTLNFNQMAVAMKCNVQGLAEMLQGFIINADSGFCSKLKLQIIKEEPVK